VATLDHPLPATGLAPKLRYALPAAALVAAIALWFAARSNPLVVLPVDWVIDISTPLGRFMTWMAREFEIAGLPFSEVTRWIGWLISQPFELLGGLMAEGFKIYREDAPTLQIPPLPWTGITGVLVLVAWRFGSHPLALLTGLSFAGFALFGLWEPAMLTVSSVGIAVLVGGFLGLALGIFGHRHPRLDTVLQPIYDVMQTLPLFSYLVPMILFFGFGPIAALMATIVYALPPMARVTTEALHNLPRSVTEFGTIAGCSRRQMTWLVSVPAVRRQLLLGVNQVIMLSLAVVIVASLIGAGGLGRDVLRALKTMRIGDAVASGLAITLVAIVLDRLSHAIAMRPARHEPAGTRRSLLQRHAVLVGAVAILGLTSLGSLVIPALHHWPEALSISPGRFGNGVVEWLGSTYADQLNGLRDTALIYLLKPVKTFFLTIPWASFVLVIGALGWLLGGWRLALLGALMFLSIAVFGYWKKAMLSLYLVLLSVGVAGTIGIALGLWAGLSKPADKVLNIGVDLLQTMPSFVYLIPAVMLFSIGDFPAFVAIVAFAVAPAIRYTSAGLRGVKPSLIEGARMSGCTPTQVVLNVRLPLALPTILLGVNQVVMMAFSMLIVTALVGTRGLEETTLVAIAKVDPGNGLMAGLAISGMAIVFDRYLQAANRKLATQLGVPLKRRVAL